MLWISAAVRKRMCSQIRWGSITGDLSAGSSWAQIATRSTPALKALRPSVFGQSSVTMNLANTAMAGGSNQFPATIETVPYGKNTYGVTTATGNYFTQGQHVQSTNYINCFGVGDCLAGSLYITSSGGYRDEADEGAHPFDRQVLEDFRTFQGTCASGCTTGSTAVTVNATSAAGTQGDGRYLIDKNPAKVISSGTLQGGGRGVLGAATFAGTNFPVSVFLQTAVAAEVAGDGHGSRTGDARDCHQRCDSWFRYGNSGAAGDERRGVCGGLGGGRLGVSEL